MIQPKKYTVLIVLIILSACSKTNNQIDSPYQLSQAVWNALNSGNVQDISGAHELTSALNEVITVSSEQARTTINELLNGTGKSISGISWDPTHDSAILAATPSTNYPVLVSNDTSTANAPAEEALVIGGNNNGSRYLAFGGNPFRNPANMNEAMEAFLQSSLQWLTGKSPDQIDHILLAHMDDSYWFPDYPTTHDWLKANVMPDVQLNEFQACDNDALGNCLTETSVDLLIISQHMHDNTNVSTIRTQLASVLEQGIPVMYLHLDGNLTELGEELFDELDVSYVKDNYWAKLKITNLSAVDALAYELPALTELNKLIAGLESGNWSFNLADCQSNCTNQPAFDEEFLNGAQYVQSLLRNYDLNGRHIFDDSEHVLDKLLILLADIYRKDLNFPMSFDTTPTDEFLRAYYSDFAQYQNRTVVPVPNNLGNFSRTEFPGVSTINKSITYTSKQSFRAAGVYALPGQTVTVTRTDSSDVVTHIFVNPIRNGATHEWDSDGYNRPKFLQGQQMLLEDSLTFTSTYGGPIQIKFSANDQPVTLNFSQVGLHPYWNDNEDNLAFQQALDANLFDWAELATPAFEVHSQTGKMIESASNPQWPDGASLAAATMTYTHNYPHVLAGFQGPGIDTVNEIHQFATDNGWTIDNLDKVKHMNADQATCGYGCSGNPYDAYWNFDPIGHGDIHELGHGLERSIFRFSTQNGSVWETHSTTNPYSYFSKSQYNLNTAQDPQCQSLPFDTIYGYLQDARISANPTDYMAALPAMNPPSWSIGAAIYIQMMMTAQAESALINGWYLWPRLHMADREFRRADDDETTWLNKRNSLGMSTISWADANVITNNDWMLLSLSFVSNRNFIPFFDLYGLSYSAIAENQVTSLGYAAISPNFYGANGSDFCLGLNKTSFPLDGTSPWPY